MVKFEEDPFMRFVYYGDGEFTFAADKPTRQISDRGFLSQAIYQLSLRTDRTSANLYCELYAKLFKFFKIDLDGRGDPPYVQHIREYEWGHVWETFYKMCKHYGVNYRGLCEDVVLKYLIDWRKKERVEELYHDSSSTMEGA